MGLVGFTHRTKTTAEIGSYCMHILARCKEPFKVRGGEDENSPRGGLKDEAPSQLQVVPPSGPKSPSRPRRLKRSRRVCRARESRPLIVPTGQLN